MLTRAEIKSRYFAKKRSLSAYVLCACGCGAELKSFDNYGRPQSYINGHNGRKYSTPGQHKREWNHRNRAARLSYKQLRSRRMKSELIRKKGGKCMRCGIFYDGENASVFHFHHRNPKTKKFCMNLMSLSNERLDRIKTEAEKCDILCANCHSILHSGKY